MEPKDLVIAIIGGLWTVTTIVITIFKESNKFRDMIITGYRDDRKLTTAHKKLMYHSDWYPFTLMGILLCLIFGLLCFYAPDAVIERSNAIGQPTSNNGRQAVLWVSRFSWSVSILMGICGIVAWIRDRNLIVSSIDHDRT